MEEASTFGIKWKFSENLWTDNKTKKYKFIMGYYVQVKKLGNKYADIIA